jgi:2-methylisocitrate lyase-like PEP mutase family enzyme
MAVGPSEARFRIGRSPENLNGYVAAVAVMAERVQERKGAAFQALHQGEPFIIPNPWDVGSARMLEALGFRALATTSSGFAFTLGRRDGGATLDELTEHVRAIDSATALPVSVDLENGHGRRLEDAAAAIRRAAEAGAVGGSIEDWDPREGLYEVERAAERVAVACQAASELGAPFMVTARAENHIRGNPDLDDTIARLLAYERAGAHVLYAPGLHTVEEIRAVCAAVSRPVNVLARPDLRFADIAEAGAQRVSVGGALTWAAMTAAAGAAERMLEDGDFSGLVSGARVGDWLPS